MMSFNVICVIMFLQTVIKNCLLISASKVYWRLQPTAAGQRQIPRDASSVAQQCLHATICKWFGRNKITWLPISPNLNPCMSCHGSDARSLFESFIRSQIQFLNCTSHWIKHAKIFHRTKLSRVLEIG